MFSLHNVGNGFDIIPQVFVILKIVTRTATKIQIIKEFEY